MDACVRALVEDLGCSVTVFYFQEDSGAPFKKDYFFDYPVSAKSWNPQAGELPESEILKVPADIILVCSWHIALYRRVAEKTRGRATRILCMDNQWSGTIKQRAGSLIAGWYIQPLYDYAFVPGFRQRDFALRLGFRESRIATGHYSCDMGAFMPMHKARRDRPLSRRFLFVGRLVREKGISVLKDAWQRYTASTKEPWSLQVTGAGELRQQLEGVPFLSLHDFVQPPELPNRMLEGDVFVLPSLYEPWGVVIHEAAATGMPIICSDACGAGDMFVRHETSGIVCQSGSADALLAAFRAISELPEGRLREFGEESFRRASQRTPGGWAKEIVAMHERVSAG